MIPMGISQITSSILNAIGLELKSLKNYAISSSLLILSIYFLPRYLGTYSLIAGYFLMSITASIMNLLMLKKRNLLSFEFLKILFKMLLISAFSALIGLSIYKLLSNISFLAMVASAGISLISMFALIYVFNIADVKMFIFKKKHKAAC